MSRKRDIRIGIWGGVGAGKSTYLTALYRHINRSKDWNLEIHPEISDCFSDYSYSFDSGNFPEVGFSLPKNYDAIQSLDYTLSPRSHSKVRKVSLNFLAAPGEFYEHCFSEDVPVIDGPKSYDDVMHYYADCDGIVVLLDQERAIDDLEYFHRLMGNFLVSLKNYCTTLKSSKSYSSLPYLAFCLSKTDQYDSIWKCDGQPDIQPDMNEIFSLVRRVIGETAFSILQGSCLLDLRRQYEPTKNRCNFYYLSSLGRFFEKGEYKKADDVSQSDAPGRNASDKKKRQEPFLEETNKPKAGSQFFKSPSQEDSYFYLERKDSSRFEVPSNSSLEPLNIFAPIDWMINSIPDYPPFLRNETIG